MNEADIRHTAFDIQRRGGPNYHQRRSAFRATAKRIRAVRESRKPSLTQQAMQALSDAVAKVVEDHRRRGIPLAFWRNGGAVSVPATEAGASRETATPYRTREAKRKG